jgi:hypothetical protein
MARTLPRAFFARRVAAKKHAARQSLRPNDDVDGELSLDAQIGLARFRLSQTMLWVVHKAYERPAVGMSLIAILVDDEFVARAHTIRGSDGRRHWLHSPRA